MLLRTSLLQNFMPKKVHVQQQRYFNKASEYEQGHVNSQLQ